MSGESIKNTSPEALPAPQSRETAEKMLASVEAAEGITDRAQQALILVIDTLQDHPEKINAFTQALEGFGSGMTRRNEAARGAEAKVLAQLQTAVPDEKFEGTSVDVRIGGVIAKLAEGIKAGTIKLDDVEIMFNLARLQDQEDRAKNEAMVATSQGVVSRDTLPESKESKSLS